MRFRKQGQAALGGEVDGSGRHGVLDHVEIVVEPDAEIGIVPRHQRPPELLAQESQILLELVEIHGLIGHARIDAEAAGVGTAQAADHRNHFEEAGSSRGSVR